MTELINSVELLLDRCSSPIIAIDGRCAAGKTTTADRLAEMFGFSVVHMDDFFLPFDMRTPERLAQPGGNIHRERFLEEAVPWLGRSFEYGVFDCSVGRVKEKRSIAAGGVIVEGVYSLHPAFGDIYDLCVFMDISPELQRSRIIERNGEVMWAMFRDRWIPMEENYINSFDVEKRCSVIISSR